MTGPASNQNPSPPATKGVPPAVNGWQGEYLDAEYQRFKTDPGSVSPDTAAFFRGFDLASAGGGPSGGSPLQEAADELVSAFRTHGHQGARTDPFGREPERPRQLDPAFYGVSAGDPERPVDGSRAGLGASVPLRDLLAHLERTYCGHVGVEFMHIPDEAQREWFRERFESGRAVPALSNAQKVAVLNDITTAEIFDRFLGKRYQGKKRFSLEGGEALIPLLRALTQRAGELGTQEIIIGMPHRGRLSVLRNWLGKDLQKLFTEFEDSWSSGEGSAGGDVKYHRGYSGDQALTGGGSVHLSMLNNPSHLESVNGVVMGRARAKQDLLGDGERRRVASVLMHGDAALPGQGVVAECLNMSRLPGYTCGGTIHVVINNLVGFTTDPEEGRSTPYCTDIAKIVNAPVLHVNGDDPEACAAAARVAAEYRHEFRNDVFIDLVCFRRYGHNEQDEPAYTQPRLYALVREHPGPGETYRRRLIESGAVTTEQAAAMVDAVMVELESGQTAARATPVNPVPPPGNGSWSGFQPRYSFESPATAVQPAVVAEVCAAMGRVPDEFNVHPKLKGLLASRAELPATGKVSHADAEQIAVGTLLLDGSPVRLSGQDSRRGTFTQRHAVLRDEKTGRRLTPLNHIRETQARFEAWDSPLSEYSVMGFDYGYSRGSPKTLVMWEGQFGDFCNTAQVIIDQYMAASEVKWHRWAGLVLLLPHGYEGQGPEHSSARMERFLQLCADDNMEVVYPSTGPQMFHLLRRQMVRDFRKPLIVMTPKKLLRAETGTIAEMSTGGFQHLIDDATAAPAGVTRVIYCSGKVYHELNDRRVAANRRDVAIVRVEQLYPFHADLAKKIDTRYPKAAQRVWVQEEPRNAGAYLYAADTFRTRLGVEPAYIGRAASASPAGASEHSHKIEQERIVTEAVAPAPAKPPESAPGTNGHAEAGASKTATKSPRARDVAPTDGA